MRLLAIRPANFRAFGPSDWIDLDSDLVVCSGANGAGKTSLAEAIEWLLFAETRRRRQGDGFSKVEYRGSYTNVHAAGPTEVSARVRPRDGAERTITRRLTTGAQGVEGSVALVDEKREGFPALGIPAGREFYPVATQHGLQEFIHAGPKERRDAFCNMVGLESLTSFKNAVDRARLSLQRTVPAEVAGARAVLKPLRERMAWHPVTAGMAAEWNEDFAGAEHASTWGLLLRAAQQETGSGEADIPRLMELLRGRLRLAAQSVFDLDGFRPPSDLRAHLNAIRSRREELGGAILGLIAAVERLVTIGTGPIGPRLLEFWQTGLRIAKAGGSPDCPMCGQDTLTPDRRAGLEGQISMHREYSDALSEVAESIRRVRGGIGDLRSQVNEIVPSLPDDSRQMGSAKLTTGAEAAIASYLQLLGALQTRWRSIERALDGYCLGLDRLSQTTNAPERALGMMESLRLEGLEAAPEGFIEAAAGVEELAALFLEVEALLAKELLSSSEVRRIDALIAGLEIRPHLAVMSAFNAVREEAASESRALEEAIKAKQQALLARFQDAICAYYDAINPSSSVRFSAIEPVTGAVRLLAESLGEQMNAAACLSTSQLNCLGLALHLVRAADPASPFGFVVLDDPFQAMDEERCERLIGEVLPRLLDREGKQVIVLTHRQDLAKRTCEVHAARQPLRYVIETTGKWAEVRREAPSAYHS